jgi:hypothetical protein
MGAKTPRRNLVRGHHPTFLKVPEEQRFRRTPSPCAPVVGDAQAESISLTDPNAKWGSEAFSEFPNQPAAIAKFGWMDFVIDNAR